MVGSVKRLESILRAAKLEFVPTKDTSFVLFANAVTNAAMNRKVQHDAESLTLGGDVEIWLDQTEKLARDLAERLAQPPRNVAFHVCRHFPFSEFEDYALSPFQLTPMLRELASAVSAARDGLEKAHLLGRSVIKKEKGMSPADRFIIDLAGTFERFLSLPAKTKKLKSEKMNSGYEPGGPFVRFVQAAADEHGLTPPGGEAIKKALAKR